MKSLWKQLKNMFDEFTDIPPDFSQNIYHDISLNLKAPTSNRSFIIGSEINEKENIYISSEKEVAASVPKKKRNRKFQNIISSAKKMIFSSDAKKKDKEELPHLSGKKKAEDLSSPVSPSYNTGNSATLSKNISPDSETKEKDVTENLTTLTKNISPDPDSAENIWEKALERLKSIVPLHSYKMWIEPIELIKIESNRIILGCPNLFSKRRVHEQYRGVIESELNTVSQKKWEVILDISDRKNDSKKRKLKKTETDPQLLIQDPHLPKLEIGNKNQIPGFLTGINNKSEIVKEIVKKGGMNGRLLRKEFTFDRFVVGTNNDFAYSASLSLASKKDLAQNSLFLLSDTGNGKSHLSQAIGHYILSNYPSQNVCYITAEDFINEMVYAFRHNSTENFKEKYRTQSDVLILEDIHFLAGKERTQTELALALDYLFDAGKKIIFTSCSLPTDIPKINDHLVSRFTSGLITRIEPPDFRTRLRILQQKLKENGCKMPIDVADYLAAELSENVRQLESGLVGVMAKSSLLNSPINLNLAQSVVKNIIRQRRSINLDFIKEVVCKHFNISPDDIVSNSRKQSVVRPRHIAIYLSRKYTDHPLQAIGRNFNKYHATVIHSISAVEKGLKTDGSLRQQIEFFCHKLESGIEEKL